MYWFLLRSDSAGHCLSSKYRPDSIHWLPPDLIVTFFNRQIDRNIINYDAALDVCICKLWSVGRAIAAGYGFSIQLILVSAIMSSG